MYSIYIYVYIYIYMHTYMHVHIRAHTNYAELYIQRRLKICDQKTLLMTLKKRVETRM
jgi:hypothetical protein